MDDIREGVSAEESLKSLRPGDVEVADSCCLVKSECCAAEMRNS